MRLKLFTLLMIGVLSLSAAPATEIRVVRFLTAPSVSGPSSCEPSVQWSSQTLFYNSTDSLQTVRFMDVSNGAPRPNPKPLSVPPHQAVTVDGADSLLDWQPSPGSILWVNRLDVPSGLVVANRVQSFVFKPDSSSPPCTGRNARYAGLALAPFAALVPAGTQQTFLGTDVGSDPSNIQVIDTRLNIGVFNGGSGVASATVRVYCGVPATDHAYLDTLLQTEQIQVPTNSIVQKAVLGSSLAAGCPSAGNSFWYATVTVDQPSFAYAIGLANGTLPTFPGTVALSYSP